MPAYAEFRRRVDIEFASGWETTVAVAEREVIGFVALKPKEAILAELFVRLERMGAGVGQALLAHAKHVMSDGFALYTTSANVRARRFYEAAGLIALRDDLHPRAGHPITYYGWRVR